MAEYKPKLLIVEDDPGLQKQLKWCFDDYEVIAATDRATAMAALRRHEPGVVLQDLGLPPDAEGVTEGFACLLETLKAAPLTKVIVVTGQLDKQNAVRAVGMGAYDFYQKPVDTDVLRLLVQRAFNIHDLEERNRALLQRQGSMPLEGVIDISPFGCRTGFHLIVWGEPTPAEVGAAIKASLEDIAERVTWDDVPGTDARSCGNYRDHSLHSAREWCRLVLDRGISLDPFDRSTLA